MARPQFEPSGDQRRSVQAMAGYGIPEDAIARTIGPKGIDPKTLRKHFRRELSLGSAHASVQVTRTLFQMAISGKCVAATIFWAKTRIGWRETSGAPQNIAPEKDVRGGRS
jgi:hypothetical protein